MEAQRSETEVRLEVNRCIRTISTSRDAVEVVASLRTLAGYLPDGPHARASASEREEFDRAHYTMVLKVLVGGLHADWRQRLTSAEHTELWGAFFLQGPPDQALLVIMDCIGTIGQSSGQDKMVDILELYLQNGRVGALLWSRCQGPGSPDSPQLRETLLGRMVSLPDLMANRLHPHNRPLFLSAQYYSLLAQEFKFALDKTCKALKDGQDCSLRFVAQLLGKTCVQGHSEHLFKDLVPHLSASTRSDMVWQRVCWRLMEDIPDRWMESVVTGLVQVVTGPAALARILGNLVVKNKKSQFVLTHKLLLLQYKYETCVLRTLLGYLAQDRERRPLLIQVLRALCQAWSSSSSVRHTPVEQQLYLCRALLLCVSLLSEAELQELRAELMQCMLGGMQCHLDSNVVRIRRIGMVVGECLSSRLNTQEAKLKFEYEQDEETKELVSMMDPFPPEDAVLTDRLDTLQISHCSKDKEMGSPEEPVTLTSHLESQGPPADKGSDSELDSDDELTPYDMSDDREMTKSAPPRYIRDCLEGLIFSEDPTRVELSLQAAEGLVRKNPSAAREVSVELTKVLLHLEDKYSTPSFLALRQAAMVALAVVDSIPVAEYLTTEFYSVNYSLRQRMDILEVLALSAQELSKPIAEQGRPSLPPSAAVTLVDPQSVPSNWRQVVEQRIQSKTRRFGKSGAPAPVTATPNRYASVAGFFFFPLLQSYDRPQVTFDLLGSDHLVLGRLVHTLGLLMHLAVNAPVATQMGRALLDFVWAIRYHTDQVVRQGVLFSVCAVFLSMPGQCLLAELSDHLLETRAWLADVAEGDADADCRTLAMQALVLLDKSLRTQLEPSALDLKS